MLSAVAVSLRGYAQDSGTARPDAKEPERISWACLAELPLMGERIVFRVAVHVARPGSQAEAPAGGSAAR